MTTTLRHHSPLGAITITGLRGLVEPDTDFELPDHLAARLLEQEDIYELVSGDPRERESQTVRQLRHELAEQGLPYDGKKEDLVARAIEADKVAAAPLLAAPEPIAPPVPPPASEAPTGDVPPTDAPDNVDEPDDGTPDVSPTEDEPTPTTTTEPAPGQEGA